MNLLTWNCQGLGSTPAVRILTDEVKANDPTLVFLAETKASVSRIKGLQCKLDMTQGIIMPCDGQSSGLAMLWKEGTNVEFKSCSHSHIDVVIHKGVGKKSWRATGFYDHPNTGIRHTSWKLLEALRNQCDLPWIVFGDFNEITHLDEKIGWLERDFLQIEGFRRCLYRCGLTDLGFVGPRFTWCNGREGEQRTLVRLD